MQTCIFMHIQRQLSHTHLPLRPLVVLLAALQRLHQGALPPVPQGLNCAGVTHVCTSGPVGPPLEETR